MIIDVILVVIFLVCLTLGWKKGFVRAFISFFGTIIAAIIAYLSYSPVAAYLRETSFYPTVLSFVRDKILSGAPTETGLTLPDFLKKPIEDALLQGVNQTADVMAKTVADLFISVLAMAAVFIIAFLTLKLISLLLNVIVRLPLLSGANKLLGLAVGFLNGYILIYLLLLVAVAAIPFSPFLDEQLRTSYISSLISSHPLF